MAKSMDRATPSRWQNFLGPILQDHFPSEIIAKEAGMTKSDTQKVRQSEIDSWLKEFAQASMPDHPPSDVVTGSNLGNVLCFGNGC